MTGAPARQGAAGSAAQRALEALGALTPAGYRLESDAAGHVWMVLEAAREALIAAGFGPSSDGALSSSDIAGRRPLEQFELSGRRALLRRFARGGLMRYLGPGFRDQSRPFRELALSAGLRARGLPTPELLFARARPVGSAYELELCTLRIEGATDISAWLSSLGREPIGGAQRADVLTRLGLTLGAWQAAGFEHADLTPRNFLLTYGAPGSNLQAPVALGPTDFTAPAARGGERIGRGLAATGSAEISAPSPKPAALGEPRLWVLDLDKSRLGPPLDELRQVALLWRLWRHILRREPLRKNLTRADRARFLRAFVRGRAYRSLRAAGQLPAQAPNLEFAALSPAEVEAIPAPPSSSWRGLWRSIAQRQQRSQAIHRLGWLFEHLLGRGPRDL